MFIERRMLVGWISCAVPVIVAGQLGTAALYCLGTPVGLGCIDRLYCRSFVPLLATVMSMPWRAWRFRSEMRRLFTLARGVSPC